MRKLSGNKLYAVRLGFILVWYEDCEFGNEIFINVRWLPGAWRARVAGGARGRGGGVVVVGVAIFVFSPQLPSREGATLEPLLCVASERKNY